jgi:hypothetical protein
MNKKNDEQIVKTRAKEEQIIAIKYASLIYCINSFSCLFVVVVQLYRS